MILRTLASGMTIRLPVITCPAEGYTRVVPVKRGLYKYIKNLMSQNNKTFHIYQILYYTHNK